MNVSDSRNVILTSLKEVPYETTFLLSDAEQDPYIKNRYWFEFPNQWANIPNKDPIIGIRSIYTTKTNRYIQYDYKIELVPYHETEAIDKVEGTIKQWLDIGDTIRPIAEYFNTRWQPKTDANDETHYGTRTTNLTDEQHTWGKYEVMCYYGYDRDTNTTNLCFGRGILETRTILVNNIDLGTDTACDYRITITPQSDDAKALFGSSEALTALTRLEIPIWSRYPLLVKSSIANNDKNNILGHTREGPIVPIKYYRLNARDKKFWIELYESSFPNCPVSLPSKVYETNNDKKKEIDRDDLIIEAIVCFSTEAMI